MFNNSYSNVKYRYLNALLPKHKRNAIFEMPIDGCEKSAKRLTVSNYVFNIYERLAARLYILLTIIY